MSSKLLLLLAVLAALWFAAPADAACNAHYTVVAGDTCTSIVAAKHSYFAEVLALNPGTIDATCSNLAVGQSVCWRDATDPTCATKSAVAAGGSCSSMATAHGATTAEILAWNPYLNSGCSNIYVGDYLCVSGTPLNTTTTTTTTTKASTSKASTTTSASPTPTQACNQSYTVKSGDGCDAIETTYNLTSAQFYALNPSVNTGCTNLAIGQILCVKASTVTTTTTTTAAPTATPSCTQSYTVQSGDGCAAIETAYSLTSVQFYALNPSVNTDCTNLAIGQILCVQARAVTTTTTTATSTISGLCSKQYIVQSGDTCSSIATGAGITTSQLISSNPQINSGCTNLSVGEALCLSAATVTSTSTASVPTSTNPLCSYAYQVISGDTCSSITTKFSMTTTQLLTLNPQVNSNCTNLAVGNVLCLQLKASTTTATAAPSSALSCVTTYSVGSGDTCNSIWTAASLTSTQFYALNPTVNTNCTNLQVGELLCLKAASTATDTSIGPTPTTYGCYQTYVVKPGDTLSAISMSTGIYQAQLIGINPALQSSTTLSIGQFLCVRDNTCPGCSQTYNVKNGDSCSSISTNFAISTSVFQQLNPYIDSKCANIFVGDDVCVSTGALTATATYPLTTPTASATPAPTGVCSQNYVVQADDTCFKIAQSSGIYLAQLYGLNPSINLECTNIQVGQSLCISSSSVPPCASRYLVQSLQTCTSIAHTSGLNTTQLQSLNPFINQGCSNLFTGDSVCVVSGVSVCNSTMTATSEMTCNYIQEIYKIPTESFNVCNPTLQCSGSISGQSICTSCVGSQPTCNKVVGAASSATCASMAASVNVSQSLFQYWNPQTDCSTPLASSNYYCVDSVQLNSTTIAAPPPLPKPACINNYTWKSTDTCTSFAQTSMLTTDSIEACNTGLNCTTDNIATGTSICSSCQYDQPTCGTLAKSTSGSTWGSFISSLSLTQGQFEACNPLASVDISAVMPSNRYYCSNCKYISASNCTANYTVASGDTCSSIVTKNKIYLAQLEINNPTLNCTTLQVGQDVCVQSVYDSTCWKSTLVSSNQTCDLLAAANNITTYDILNLNFDLDSDCSNVYPGDTICLQGVRIPDLSPPPIVPVCTANYTVASGDSCSTIAQKYSTYVSQIVALNPTLNYQCTNIAVGQVLCTENSIVPTCEKHATIGSGDSCSTIAAANNVTGGVTGVVAYNPYLLSTCTNIFPGDTLCVNAPSVIVNGTGTVTTTTPSVPWTVPPANIGCAQRYDAVAGDNCTTVATAYNISTLTLLRYNQGLYNCTDLGGQSLCVVPDIPGCANTYVVTKQNTTCEYIQNRYGLSNDTFNIVNPGINCSSPLPLESTACIDNLFTDCTHNYTSVAGDTCTTVQNQFGLTANAFGDINPTLSCSGALSVGSKVCVGSTFAQCSQIYTSVLGDTCAILAQEYFRNSTAAFSNLNPNLNCSFIIPINTKLCLQSNQQVGCGDVYSVKSSDTCASIESSFKLTSDVFNALNPGIICNVLNAGQNLCVAASTPNCKSSVTATGNDTCASIQTTYNITDTNFYLYNPQIDCSAGNITANAQVCISAPQLKLPSQQFMSEAVNQFGSLNPQLETLYLALQANPTQATENQFVSAIVATLSSSDALTLLQNLTATDPYFKAAEQAGADQRKQFCDFTNGNSFFKPSNACFCGSSLPLLYCNALYTQEIDAATANSAFAKRGISTKVFQEGLVKRFHEKYPEFIEERKQMKKREVERQKRHPLQKRLIESWCDPTSLSNLVGDTPEAPQGGEESQVDACTTQSCVWPVTGFFEVRIAEEFCIQEDTMSGSGTAQQVADNYEELSLDFCLSNPGIDEVLAIFDLSPICLDIKARYWNNRGVLEVDGELNIIVSIEGSLMIKLMPSDEDLCQGTDFCKNDYCYVDMWHAYEEVHVFIHILWWTKDIYGPKTYSLPACNPPQTPTTQPTPPSQPYGRVLKAYYPNWTFYHNNNEIVEITPEIGSMLTHINYAFSMVSYSPEMDSYYLDPTDLFADTGACSGMNTLDCAWSTISSFFFGGNTNENCMQIPSSYQCAPGVISMVPYFGYKESDGTCPKTTCYNAGGPEGGRNPSCSTQMDGTTLKESPDDSTILACGQFNYLLNLMNLQDPALSHIRVILSIGGWYDANYFTAATDAQHVDNFVNSIVSILEFFPFDGVDIDWEYPGFEHGDEPLYGQPAYGDRENTQDCTTSQCQDSARANDPANYVTFLNKLRQALNTAGPNKNGRNKHGDAYELSIAAPAGFDKYKVLNMAAICQAVTHVNLMTYDMHGAWDSITNHQAPIYDNTPGATGQQYSIDDAVTSWVGAGCPSSKIVLGVPFYSRTEAGVEPGQAYGSSEYPGLYQPFMGAQMDATAMPTFGQIVSDPAWTTYWDPWSQASWAWNPTLNYFASYDSEKALANKMCYAGAKGLAGGMVWLLGQDSADNRALKAVSQNLGCTTLSPRLLNPPNTVEGQPGESCPVSLAKRDSTQCQIITSRMVVVRMVQVGRGDAFIIESQLWSKAIVPGGTTVQNMLSVSGDGGTLKSTKSIMIDSGKGSIDKSNGPFGSQTNISRTVSEMAISNPPQASMFDVIILTHGDTDHIGGMVSTLSGAMPVERGIPWFRPLVMGAPFEFAQGFDPVIQDPGTAFMHDSQFDMRLRSSLQLATSTKPNCKIVSDSWVDSSVAPGTTRTGFVNAVGRQRSASYGKLLGYLAGISDAGVASGTWVSSYGQTNNGNTAGGSSPYFGAKGIGLLLGATNLDTSNSLRAAFQTDFMCGLGTGVADHVTPTDDLMDVDNDDMDEDLTDDLINTEEQIGDPGTTDSGELNNMVSTITEMASGTMQMLFTGDMNEYEWRFLKTLRTSWPTYAILKVPHHCSKIEMPGLYSSITANVYLISGKTSGKTVQPAASCLTDIITSRQSKADIGIGHIFVTNWITKEDEKLTRNQVPDPNYDLAAALQNLDATSNKYRIYLLKDGISNGAFRISDAGDVVINTNDWTDMTPGVVGFDKVLQGPFAQVGGSTNVVGALVF